MKLITIKAIRDWELEVLGIPFGSPMDKDAQDQWFDSKTLTHADKYPTVPVVYYHGFTPEGLPSQAPVYIGTAKYERTDADGHWYRVVLDQTKDLAHRVWDAAKKLLAAASSGSVPHLARIRPDGYIQEWPVVELSVFDTGPNRAPANHHAVALPILKSSWQSAGLALPEIADPAPELTDETSEEVSAPPQGVSKSQKQGEMKMSSDNTNTTPGVDPKAVADEVARQLKVIQDNQAAEAKMKADFEDAVKAKVEEQVADMKAKMAADNRLGDPSFGAPHVRQFHEGKYEGEEPATLSLTASILKSAGKPISPVLLKSLAYKLLDDKSKDAPYFKSALRGHGYVDAAAVKAAEVMATSDSGNGSDWVATAYASEIWNSIRAESTLVSKLPSVVIPDGYASQYFPLEDADPTWYKVPEVTDENATTGTPNATITSSKAGTGQRQITVNKAGARSTYSGELTEDSIVPFAPQLRTQLAASGQDIMEALVINGDTDASATTNINDIAGTPASTDWFLIMNGFRKLALVTNTANARSAGGALDITDYLETMKLMGTAGLAASDLSKLLFIVDPNVHFANMAMTQVALKDTFSGATFENGFLKYAYTVPIHPSWQFHKGSTALKANTAGKVDIDTQGNNTTGSIICVRLDQWKFGYKRKMTIELTRIPRSDAWELVALTRVGMAYRDTEAAAISYNVGV